MHKCMLGCVMVREITDYIEVRKEGKVRLR
jgi:hypothetical protein